MSSMYDYSDYTLFPYCFFILKFQISYGIALSHFLAPRCSFLSWRWRNRIKPRGFVAKNYGTLEQSLWDVQNSLKKEPNKKIVLFEHIWVTDSLRFTLKYVARVVVGSTSESTTWMFSSLLNDVEKKNSKRSYFSPIHKTHKSTHIETG